MANKCVRYWELNQNPKDEKHTHNHPIVQVAYIADLKALVKMLVVFSFESFLFMRDTKHISC